MVKRRGDTTPEPPGGRAAERLRMFIESQRVTPEKEVKKRRASVPDEPPPKEAPRAKQDRRKTRTP
jgi:hypothetical protein